MYQFSQNSSLYSQLLTLRWNLILYRDSILTNVFLHDETKEWIDEVNKFLPGIELDISTMTDDWYLKKIAKIRTLMDKQTSILFYPDSKDVGSSSINVPNESYQIFLSFRGEDTRYNFTGNLYHALQPEGFKVFMDDRGLKRGDPISQVIMGAIENSKLSIVVFSENFADSTWCLDEVVKILECKEKKNQLVWPIFYKVEPSDVRHQRNSYKKAMVIQETRFGKDSEMVKKWRSALSQICGLNAFHYKENSGYEHDFIQGIVKDVIKIRDSLKHE